MPRSKKKTSFQFVQSCIINRFVPVRNTKHCYLLYCIKIPKSAEVDSSRDFQSQRIICCIYNTIYIYNFNVIHTSFTPKLLKHKTRESDQGNAVSMITFSIGMLHPDSVLPFEDQTMFVPVWFAALLLATSRTFDTLLSMMSSPRSCVACSTAAK